MLEREREKKRKMKGSGRSKEREGRTERVTETENSLGEERNKRLQGRSHSSWLGASGRRWASMCQLAAFPPICRAAKCRVCANLGVCVNLSQRCSAQARFKHTPASC